MNPFAIAYLARHGQTEWNTQGRKQGRLDSPLTALGVRQARANGASLRGAGIDAVFTSPIGRARTTAAIIADALALPVAVIDDLSELDHGAWSGLVAEQIESGWPGALEARERDRYRFRFPGGESYADADLRAGLALDAVAATGARRPLLVSHEMIGRMLLKRLAGLDAATALASSQPSDVVYRIDASGAFDRLR